MSWKYMLDTDSVSYALRNHGNVGARILEHKPSELCISAVTLAELRFGAEKRDKPKESCPSVRCAGLGHAGARSARLSSAAKTR